LLVNIVRHLCRDLAHFACEQLEVIPEHDHFQSIWKSLFHFQPAASGCTDDVGSEISGTRRLISLRDMSPVLYGLG